MAIVVIRKIMDPTHLTFGEKQSAVYSPNDNNNTEYGQGRFEVFQSAFRFTRTVPWLVNRFRGERAENELSALCRPGNNSAKTSAVTSPKRRPLIVLYSYKTRLYPAVRLNTVCHRLWIFRRVSQPQCKRLRLENRIFQ